MNAGTTPAIAGDPLAAPRRFSAREKMLLWLIGWAGFLLIRLIGPTLRFSVSREDGAPQPLFRPPRIYAFWHRCVIPAAWLCRNARIRVMTSQSFDGEYIARIIEKLGFLAVRGSSSRGGMEALRQMAREAHDGLSAFTADGPRGPKYVAKSGPIWLGKATQAPVAVFHIAVEKAWVLNSWDQFMIPKPFSRALGRVSREIHIPAEADHVAMQELHRELQQSLDRVREYAEQNVGQVGSERFPIFKGELSKNSL